MAKNREGKRQSRQSRELVSKHGLSTRWVDRRREEVDLTMKSHRNGLDRHTWRVEGEETGTGEEWTEVEWVYERDIDSSNMYEKATSIRVKWEEWGLPFVDFHQTTNTIHNCAKQLRCFFLLLLGRIFPSSAFVIFQMSCFFFEK